MNDLPRRERSAGEPTAPLWAPGGPQSPPPSGPPSGHDPFGTPRATQPLTTDVPASAPTPGVPGAAGAVGAERPRRRGAGLVAGVIAAAVIAGGGAGVGAAALYSSGEGGGAADPVQTSQVVDASAPAGEVEQVAAKVLPSVVKIEVAGQGEAGSGSGIIVSSDGEIITNEHVVSVAGADGRVVVDFSDGSSAEARILGTDPLTDTALIKAEGVSGLTPATLGKSADLRVGQGVVAIGSPFGLDSTVTSGIVSALDRPVNVGSDGSGNATVYPAIQTDAAINPGNSGGALVDMNGNVVGINASIRTTGTSSAEAGSIGLGFAIPIDEVMPIVEQIRDGDEPTHARMGVTVSDNTAQGSDLASGDGAHVESVERGSAASEIGIEEGSVITKVDDTHITGSDALVAKVRSYRPGDEVTVTWVTPDGSEESAKLTLDSD